MRYTNKAIRTIDDETMDAVLTELSERSAVIAEIIGEYGRPLLWRREPGFASLVYTILEQQVSLSSAKATYEKLISYVGNLTPESILRMSDSDFRTLGFSRQKIEYCRTIAELIERGVLDLESLNDKSDDHVRTVLTNIRGIGRWSADIYLLHSLGRPDVWPVGDLALQVAVGERLNLESRPDQKELERIGEPFRPWRSVAARVFWQYYLTDRGITEVS